MEDERSLRLNRPPSNSRLKRAVAIIFVLGSTAPRDAGAEESSPTPLVSAAASRSDGSFEAVDEILEQLAFQLERYRIIARGPEGAPQPPDDGLPGDSASIRTCREDLAFPSILKDVKANLRYLRYSPKLFSIYNSMLHYQLCESEASGKPLCEDVRAFERPTGMAHDTGYRLDRTCRHALAADALARSALLRAPDAQERCVDYVRVSWKDEPGLIDLEKGRRFCRIYLEHWDDPDAACVRMFEKSVFIERGSAWRKNCAPALRSLIGDERFCRELKAPNHGIDVETDYQSCMDYAALRRARDARDARACGESDFCLRAMGAGAGCADEEAVIRDWYCGRFKILTANVDKINELFNAAFASLDRSGPRDGPDWASREAKLRGLVSLGVSLLPKYGDPGRPLRWNLSVKKNY